MIIYTDQMKHQELNTDIEIKRKHVTKRCLDIMTFDIEVSSAWMDPKRGLIPYEPGYDAEYWNDLEAYALPYIWQFSFNDVVYYGRDIKTFKRVLDDLSSEYNYIIWIHNLSYEFCFLINFLEVADIFARSPHKPIYCRFKDYEHITFRCSYMLTNLSLASWGKQLKCLKKVGDLDYRQLRTPLTILTDTELGYCEQDCIVVYEGIKKHLEKYKNIYDIPTTSTGKVRRPVKKMVTADAKYMRDIKRTIPKDADDYMLQQSVFAGGYTHGNRKFVGKLVTGDIHHVDIASSYPFCMAAFKYPYNAWAYVGRQLPEPANFENTAYIIKLHIKGLRCISWNTYISSSKTRGSGYLYDNGRVLKADDLYYTCTEQDYLTILNNYVWDSIESEGTWLCHKRYLPTIFISYLLSLYKNKTELKGIDDPDGTLQDRYMTSKAYINSMFGMCCTNPFNAEVSFKDGEWLVGDLTADYVNERLDTMRVWYNKRWFLSYSVGCWITAYARRRLWSAIEKCDKDLLYTDTDSLFYLNKYDWSWFNESADERLRVACEHHNIDFALTRPTDPKGILHPLGHFDHEPDCDMFKTLGAKKYIEHREGKLFMTVAGINKSAVDCLNGDINKFSDGFIFDKDHGSVHKLEHKYLTDMKPVTYPDGYHSDLRYGLSMRPTGYKLSLPNVYDRLEDLYDFITHPSDADIIRRRGIIK